jgi:hypothetical protein
MKKSIVPRRLQVVAVLAAAAYGIAAADYIIKLSFAQTWILYVGNAFFAVVVAVYMGWLYKTARTKPSVIELIRSGHIAAIAGIVSSLILCLILLLLLQPAVFHPAGPDLQKAPAQLGGTHHGFALLLFADAILGNAAASFLISILLPFSIVRNQRTGAVQS